MWNLNQQQILKWLVQIGTNYGTINGSEKTRIFEYCGVRENGI